MALPAKPRAGEHVSRAGIPGGLIEAVTLDRYGHLFHGSEEEAASLLDAYLADAHERARPAEINVCGEKCGENPRKRRF